MRDITKGIVFSLLTVLLSIITSMIVKTLAQEIAVIHILFSRFWFSLPILFIISIYIHKNRLFFINNKLAMSLRLILGLAGISLWFLAIQNMSLGLATALIQSSIIFVTLASPFLLKEKIGVYRWSAVIIGMLGVVIITNPFSNSMNEGVIYGIAASLVGAALSITLRKLGKSDSPITVTLVHNVSGAVIILLSMTFIFSTPPYFTYNGSIWALLLLLGVIASFLQLSVTLAYRYSDAVVVTTLRYLQLPLAGMAGYIYFTEIPSMMELIGAAAIFISCVVIVWREFVRKTEQSPEEAKLTL